MYHYVNYTLWRDEVKGMAMNAKNLTMFKPVYIDPSN
jgi:hypothetical protein